MNLKRNPYASIELKKHILTNDYQFDFLDSNVTATDEDEEIVNDLLNEIEEYEIHDFKGGTGEWLWLQNNKQKDFIHTITNKKVKQLSLKLASMFKNDSTYGYLSPSFYDVNNDPEMVKSDILHNIDETKWYPLDNCDLVYSDKHCSEHLLNSLWIQFSDHISSETF